MKRPCPDAFSPHADGSEDRIERSIEAWAASDEAPAQYAEPARPCLLSLLRSVFAAVGEAWAKHGWSAR